MLEPIFKYYCEPYNQKSTDNPCNKRPPYAWARMKCKDCKGVIELNKTKICTGCKEELPLTDFYSDRSKKDNLSTRCKKCKKSNLGVNKKKKQKYIDARLAIAKHCKRCYEMEKEMMVFVEGFIFKEELFKMKKCKKDNCCFLQWSPYIKN